MLFPRIDPTNDNAEVYNTISYWLETMLKIEDDKITITEKDAEAASEDLVIRLDYDFKRIISTYLPCDSTSSTIQLELNEDEEPFIQQSSNQNKSNADAIVDEKENDLEQK